MISAPYPHDADVIIVGAGPSGTFLANLLGQAGLSCLLLEKRTALSPHSMAIGVMPPSLQRLEQLGLDETVVQAGIRVTRASILADTTMLGTLDLSALPPPHNFVLSIPQSSLVALLREKLTAWPHAQLRLGVEVVSLKQADGRVEVDTRDTATGQTQPLTARFVVACDGSRSQTRTGVGIAFHGHTYNRTFMMADFPESTPWEGEARLFFTPNGSIESFPLPAAHRRWVIQSDATEPDAAVIARRIQAITGISLDAGRADNVTTFTPERRLCSRYFKGRVILCGDAAHVMSPIGGQGMNTGLADAWHLASVLERLCKTGEPPERLLACYEKCRRDAFRVAANRAARGMWLGTLGGATASSLRRVFIRRILLGSALRQHLAPYFAMLTIPDQSPLHEERIPVGIP